MARPLRVLIVEDSPDDAELMLIELRRGGFDPSWQRVESAAALRDALAHEPWEVILWDYTLPGFDAMAALALLTQTAEDLPFLVVSGTIGEEQAVQLMKAGADDYLLKGNLARLASAVDRTLREAAERRARRVAEIERDRLLGQLRLQIERLPLAYILFDADYRVLDWNPAAEKVFGYTKEEMVGQVALNVIVPLPVRDQLQDILRRIRAGDMDARSVNENVTKDGRIITCEWFNTPLMDSDGRFVGVISLAQDITERMRAEEALRESEERFRGTFENAAVGIAHKDADGRFLRVNETYCGIVGYTREELLAADLPGHHLPRGTGGRARAIHPAHEGRAIPILAGEALHPQGRFDRLDRHEQLAPARRGGRPRLRHRDPPGHLRPQAVGVGTAVCQGGGGGCEPGQGRVPGQRQPRDPHALRGHPRHDRSGPRHAADGRPAAMLDDGQVGGRQPPRPRRGPARLREDRGRQAGAGPGRVLAPGDAQRHCEDPDRAGPVQGAGARLPCATGCARRIGRRRRPAETGGAQPGQQCHQVHRAGRGGGARGSRQRPRASRGRPSSASW